MTIYREFVFIELQHPDVQSIHIIKIPQWGEPYGRGENPYRQIGTYEAFRQHWLTKIFAPKVYPASLNGNPRYFKGKCRDEWESDRKMWADFAKENNPTKPWKDQYADKPIHEHDSMWKFYEFIKWDYKKKRFI